MEQPRAAAHAETRLFCSTKQWVESLHFRGASLAFGMLRSTCALLIKVSFAIMVSIWWLLWAFVVGGYSGMLLISLMLVARRTTVRGWPDRL